MYKGLDVEESKRSMKKQNRMMFFAMVFSISGLILSTAGVFLRISEASTKPQIILQPTADSVWGTALPMDCVDAHPHFQWTNKTPNRAELSLVYQGKFDEEPTGYKEGDEIAIMTTGGGDQNIGWNPADNIYDGRWKAKVVIGEIVLWSETFGISSKG